MKTIQIDFNIAGLDGVLELREPSISDVRPFMDEMGSDTQAFLLNVLNISLYSDGVRVEDALSILGFSTLAKITPLVTEMLGFDSSEDDEKKD